MVPEGIYEAVAGVGPAGWSEVVAVDFSADDDGGMGGVFGAKVSEASGVRSLSSYRDCQSAVKFCDLKLWQGR